MLPRPSGDSNARKAILVACGSFNPPTNGHLRMMVVAREILQASPAPFEILEGIFSPVSSSYAHKQLESNDHRMTMLNKATESSDWLRADDWEQQQGIWTETIEAYTVLKHHRESARLRWNDPDLACFFVCGDDLVNSFSHTLPDGRLLWSVDDVKAIVEDFGIVMNIRSSYGSNPIEDLRRQGLKLDKCFMVTDRACPHQMSSTLLREAVEDGRSIRYCAADAVVDYINEHHLYKTINDRLKKEEQGRSQPSF